MTRRSAAIATDIWRDTSFRALRMHSQLLYFSIRTTPTLSKIGVTVELPDLWAEWTGMSLGEIQTGLDDLAAHNRIYRDPETLELFVPDAFVHEQVARTPSHLERAIRDAKAVHSLYLRQQIALLLEADGSPRALTAAAALHSESPTPPRPGFVSPMELRAIRRAFLKCAGRRRLRAEIAAGAHQCAQCAAGGELTVDHRQPLARGGTNHPSNLQVLCLTCNLRKGVTF